MCVSALGCATDLRAFFCPLRCYPSNAGHGTSECHSYSKNTPGFGAFPLFPLAPRMAFSPQFDLE